MYSPSMFSRVELFRVLRFLEIRKKTNFKLSVHSIILGCASVLWFYNFFYQEIPLYITHYWFSKKNICLAMQTYKYLSEKCLAVLADIWGRVLTLIPPGRLLVTQCSSSGCYWTCGLSYWNWAWWARTAGPPSNRHLQNQKQW